VIELRILGASVLRGRDDQSVGSVLHQPKRLALLAYLALNASETLLRRDRLLALFWPTSPESRARSSLSEALSRLRSSLGPDIVVTRGNDEVGLRPGAVWCDAVELRIAADHHDWQRVAELYGGPLLDGLILDGLHDLERWLDGTRDHLARVALDAAGRLADEAAGRHDPDALALAERAMEIDPLDGDAVRRVMTLLARGGHRAAALSVFDRFAEQIRAQRGVEPAGSVLELGEMIRAGTAIHPAPPVRAPSPAPPVTGTPAPTAAEIPPSTHNWRWTAIVAAGLIVAFMAGAALNREAPDEVRRYSLALPPDQALTRQIMRPRVALAPDGSRLLYVAGPTDSDPRLHVRPRDELTASPLHAAVRATNPFFSPDGRRFGYLRGPGPDQAVMLGAFNGEPPTALVENGVGLAGATWSADRHIYYDGVTAGGTTGLMRAHEDGGAPEQVTAVDTAGGEVDHVWPSALPGGRGVLFTVLRDEGPEAADVAVLDGRSGRTRVLVRALTARYVEPGYLLFLLSDGTLSSVGFDLDRLAIRGTAQVLATGVSWRLNGATDLAVSASGTLAYVPGPRRSDPAELVWIDRQGRVEPAEPGWKGDFATLALSDDGSHVAISRLPATWFDVQELFVRDLTSGATSILAGGDATQNFKPAWSPDARTVTFLSDRAGDLAIWSRRVDRPDTATLVLDAPTPISDFTRTKDGEWLVYVVNGDMFARREGTDRSQQLTSSPAAESFPALSPDGRWLAYTSDESGRREVYVASFPTPTSARRVVSVEGGSAPAWARSGREIFYETADGSFAIVPVEVDEGGALRGGEPTRLAMPRPRWRNSRGGGFAVSLDDQRILTLVEDTVTRAEELIVTDGLPELLRRHHGG
jgi:serine/threonine-protein kinase